MNANVIQLPGTAPVHEVASLNLSVQEVVDASGGYTRPADQLKSLQARGFVRAFRKNGAGAVILERAHYDAVVRGQFGQQLPANDPGAPRTPLPPNRAGYRKRFGKAGA